MQCNSICHPRRWSTKTSSSRYCKRKKYYSLLTRSNLWVYLTTTSCPWRSFFQSCQKTKNSGGTCQIQVKKIDCLSEPSSGTSHILCTGIMCRTLSSMRITSACRLMRTKKNMKTSWFLRGGGRSWTQCLLSPVSFVSFSELTNFMYAEHKGKTLHLLKQASKPVCQERKRRKYSVYEGPGFSAP